MTSKPRVSCVLPPSKRVVEYAKAAESAGYHRMWLFDSPALYGDIWSYLALIVEGTERIGVGTGVAIPSLRHPMVTASAIATIEDLSPSRLIVAFGTGFTGRITMGQRPMKWDDLATYVRQLQALLGGDRVEIEGRVCEMLHTEGFAPSRPIDVPLWVAPSGPRGVQVSRDLGVSGVVTPILAVEGVESFAERALMTLGTVVRPGEDHTSQRLIDAIGPGYTTMIHGMYEYDPSALDGIPGGPEWRARIEAESNEDDRYLAVHQGHLCSVTERDRAVVEAAGPRLLQTGWTGDNAAIAAKLKAVGDAGVTELLYMPAGPDIVDELQAFAVAAMSTE